MNTGSGWVSTPAVVPARASDKQRRQAKLLTVIGAIGCVSAVVLTIFMFARPDIFSFLSLVAIILLYFLLLPTVAAIVAMVFALSGKVKSRSNVVTLIVMGICGCVVAVLAAVLAVFVFAVLAIAT